MPTLDPRGPERTITCITEERTPCREGILFSLIVTLSCGHTSRPNPIFKYVLGEPYRCLCCLKETEGN